MLEFIREIPGPMFLLYYAIFVTIVIIIGYYYKKSYDKSMNFQFPADDSLDAYSLALMKSKLKYGGLIRLIIFSLLTKKRIKISGKRKDAVIEYDETGNASNLHKIESYILQFVKSAKNKQLKIIELNQNKRVKETITDFIQEINNKLEQKKLIHTKQTTDQMKLIKWICITCIILLGVIKSYLGLIHDKPVEFLILFIFISLIIAFIVLKINYLTQLGTTFLKQKETQNQWMKNSLVNNNYDDGYDPTFALALFGIAVIASCSAFTDYNEAYHVTQSSSSSGGCGSSGCSGSSCSSSSCSGSSCGGSSCSGGGCGGCGGGGD